MLSTSHQIGIGVDSLCCVWEWVFLLPATTSDHYVTVLSCRRRHLSKLSILFVSKFMSDVTNSLTCYLLADLLISINSIRSHLRFSISSLLSFKLDWFCLRSQVTCALTTLEHCTPLAFFFLLRLNDPALNALLSYSSNFWFPRDAYCWLTFWRRNYFFNFSTPCK